MLFNYYDFSSLLVWHPHNTFDCDTNLSGILIACALDSDRIQWTTNMVTTTIAFISLLRLVLTIKYVYWHCTHNNLFVLKTYSVESTFGTKRPACRRLARPVHKAVPTRRFQPPHQSLCPQVLRQSPPCKLPLRPEWRHRDSSWTSPEAHPYQSIGRCTAH